MGISYKEFKKICDASKEKFMIIPSSKGCYLMLDSNLVVSYVLGESGDEYISFDGKVPLNLAQEIYDNMGMDIFIDNSKVNFYHHITEDFNKVLAVSLEKQIDITAAYEKLSKEVYLNDYENCYLKHFTVASFEGFVWLIDKIQTYCNLKKSEDLNHSRMLG